MKKTIELLSKGINMYDDKHESKTAETKEYKNFIKVFKHEFLKELMNFDYRQGSLIVTPNYTTVDGFFQLDCGIFYFILSDVEHPTDSIMLRTAKSFTDSSGGMNHYLSLTNLRDQLYYIKNCYKFEGSSYYN